MDLKTWRQRGEQVTLPSGLVVRLRPVSVLDLALQGTIPVPLTGELEALIIGREAAEFSLAEFAKLAPVFNGVVKAAMVEPPVADQPDEEHLGVEELPAIDRLFIFQWAHREASQADSLRLFRAGPGESVDSAQSG